MSKNDGSTMTQVCNPEVKESTLTLKWGVIVSVIVSFTIAVLGFFGIVFNATLTNAKDIAKVETEIRVVIPEIKATLSDMKALTKEIREDQWKQRGNRQ